MMEVMREQGISCGDPSLHSHISKGHAYLKVINTGVVDKVRQVLCCNVLQRQLFQDGHGTLGDISASDVQ